jgi:hypothetical protein
MSGGGDLKALHPLREHALVVGFANQVWDDLFQTLESRCRADWCSDAQGVSEPLAKGAQWRRWTEREAVRRDCGQAPALRSFTHAEEDRLAERECPRGRRRTNVSKLQRIRALDTKVLPSGIVIEKYARAR